MILERMLRNTKDMFIFENGGRGGGNQPPQDPYNNYEQPRIDETPQVYNEQGQRLDPRQDPYNQSPNTPIINNEQQAYNNQIGCSSDMFPANQGHVCNYPMDNQHSLVERFDFSGHDGSQPHIDYDVVLNHDSRRDEGNDYARTMQRVDLPNFNNNDNLNPLKTPVPAQLPPPVDIKGMGVEVEYKAKYF